MGGCRSYLTERSLRRRAVLTVALLLLGCQLAGGSLHAAGTAHDPESECHFCLALDRVDTPVAASVHWTVAAFTDKAPGSPIGPTLVPAVHRPCAIRAPPVSRRS